MKKTVFFSLLLTIFCALTFTACNPADFMEDLGLGNIGGTVDVDPFDDGTQYDPSHTCDYRLYSTTEPTCTSDGEMLFVCTCGKWQSEIIPASHTPVSKEGKAAGCTVDGYTSYIVCSECDTIISGGETLSATGHTEIIDPATDSTDTTPAKTEGKHCSVCGYVIVRQEFVYSNDFSNPNSYDGSYAYESLQKLNNGEKLTTLYNLIDTEADYFHSSSIDAPDTLEVATVEFASLGLTCDDALAVWSAYKSDHPLYYWISGTISYTDSYLNLLVDEEYADSEARVAYNSYIYEKVEEFVCKVSSSTAYTTALTFHDLIILSGDYAYKEDGVTPSDSNSAHNILGILYEGEGVCESYAKAFQLLLNFCGVDNIIVSGWAGEAHAWNLVKLDDGEWYWCDLTWDDTPDFFLGVSYRYFCVNDTQNVGWCDGPWVTASDSFISSHWPAARVDTGISYAYDLPLRSENAFSSADILLRDTFTVSGLTYAVSGYNSVQLVYIHSGSNISVPDTVEYGGVTFNVTSIGRIDENGLFKTGSIAYDYAADFSELLPVKSISIPRSVAFIWDGALDIDALESIEVDSENEAFASLGGVLFTKDYTTLIKYPSGKSATTYTVPDETKQIAAGAFEMFYYNLNLKLESITLGESVELAGIANYGYGYEDSSNGNFVSDEWDNIRSYLSGSATIYTKSGAVFEEISLY